MPGDNAIDDAFFERAYRRMFVLMAVCGAIGTIVALWSHGIRGAAGFLLGALFSIFNFRSFKQLAHSLGRNGPPNKGWRAFVFGARYFLFGIVGYVIVKVFGISLLTVLAGLFVAAAAVLLEIIYELIYARA